MKKKIKKEGEKDYLLIIKIVFLIIGIFGISIFTHEHLIENLSEGLIKELILPIIFATFGLGLIGLTINEKSKFKKLRIDFITASLSLGVSGLLGILYLVYTKMPAKYWIGMISITLFTAGLVYYLIILSVSIYLIYSKNKPKK